MAEPEHPGARRHVFRREYAARLGEHVGERDEPGLRAAYELGRDAVIAGLSILDVAAVHHEALVGTLGDASSPHELEARASAAGEFFLEALSAFEMVQRGLREAREAAAAERRSSTMLRQLSSLLADPSLALDELDSAGEALRLVAEEARELTRARWCVASAALDPARRLTEVAAEPDPPEASAALAEPEELERRHALVRATGGAVRLTERDAREHPAFAMQRNGDDPRVHGWMAAPLTSLDGRDFGYLEVFDSERGGFSELDEAVLVHLAQMASLALERAHLYRHGGS